MPRPVPTPLGLVVKNGSNTRASVWASIPTPVSLSAMLTYGPGSTHECSERSASSRRMRRDRKSTRLNSSHMSISYAVFCLKQKNKASRQVRRQIANPTIQTLAACRLSGLDQEPVQRRGRDHAFFFNDTATTEIYTLSLHDALPILRRMR